jgi:hypothetical protein
MEELKLEGAKFQADQAEKNYVQQFEMFQLQQQDRFAQLESQLEQVRLTNENQIKLAELQQKFQKAQADLAVAQEQLAIKRQELSLEIQKAVESNQIETFKAQLEAEVATSEQSLKEAKLQLDQAYVSLSEREKLMEEQRLAAEQVLEQQRIQIDALTSSSQQVPQPPQIVMMPQPKVKKVTRHVRDQLGNLIASETEEVPLE